MAGLLTICIRQILSYCKRCVVVARWPASQGGRARGDIADNKRGTQARFKRRQFQQRPIQHPRFANISAAVARSALANHEGAWGNQDKFLREVSQARPGLCSPVVRPQIAHWQAGQSGSSTDGLQADCA
jgi:hypothetical protein